MPQVPALRPAYHETDFATLEKQVLRMHADKPGKSDLGQKGNLARRRILLGEQGTRARVIWLQTQADDDGQVAYALAPCVFSEREESREDGGPHVARLQFPMENFDVSDVPQPLRKTFLDGVVREEKAWLETVISNIKARKISGDIQRTREKIKKLELWRHAVDVEPKPKPKIKNLAAYNT